MITCKNKDYTLENIVCEVKADRPYLGYHPLASVYVIHHDEESYIPSRELAMISNVFHPIHIPTTKYFESIVFVPEVFELLHTGSTYTGFITYKYKTESHSVDIESIISDNPGYDLYALIPERNKMKLKDEPWHPPPFQDVMKALFIRLGMDVNKVMEGTIFYRNYWVAKSEIVKEYAEFMWRAINIIENDPSIRNMFLGNAHYNGGRLKPDFLTKLTGKPYYTMHPFILERLICAYVVHKGLRVHYV